MPFRVFALSLSVLLLSQKAHAATSRDCERFLKRYISFAEENTLPIPLQNGRIEDLEEMTFLSTDEVRDYLISHPKSPWAEELAAITPEFFLNGQLVYLSSVGPTGWRMDDLSNFVNATQSGLTTDKNSASRIIMKLALGGTVKGLSPESHERVRNALLAELEAENTRREGALKVYQISPRAYGSLFVTEEYSTQSHAVAREMRESAPSLNIRFEVDVHSPQARTATSFAQFLKPLNSDRLPWVGRIIVREALIRRKLVLDETRHLVTLGQKISDDQIFMLAAHPEAAPFWKYWQFSELNIRHYNLLSSAEGTYAPLLAINRKDDQCILNLDRFNWESNPREIVGIQMNFSISYDQRTLRDMRRSDVVRMVKWLNREWDLFTDSVHLKGAVRPAAQLDVTLDEVTIDFNSLPHHQIISFYTYLTQKYPCEPVTSQE